MTRAELPTFNLNCRPAEKESFRKYRSRAGKRVSFSKFDGFEGWVWARAVTSREFPEVESPCSDSRRLFDTDRAPSWNFGQNCSRSFLSALALILWSLRFPFPGNSREKRCAVPVDAFNRRRVVCIVATSLRVARKACRQSSKFRA